MQYFENDEQYKPDFDADLDERQTLFLKELNAYGGCLFRFYQPRNQALIVNSDQLSNHYDLEQKHAAGKPTAAFGFKKESDLDYRIKEKCFGIFFKHFPEGIQSSLVGYPDNTHLLLRS